MLTLYEAEEIYRDCLSLMDELEERMLTVSSWFPEIDLANRIVDFDAETIYSFPIRLIKITGVACELGLKNMLMICPFLTRSVLLPPYLTVEYELATSAKLAHMGSMHENCTP